MTQVIHLEDGCIETLDDLIGTDLKLEWCVIILNGEVKVVLLEVSTSSPLASYV
jgi:hypothetical protein